MEYRLRPWDSWSFFCKATIIRQLRKWNESKIEKNTKKNRQKTVGISYESMCGCKCVSVCGCVCMRVCVR